MRPHYYLHNTHLCSHTKTLFNTDPIWSVPRKIVFAPLLLLLVSGGDVRRARTHRDAADTRRRREREREREKETRIYRTTTTPPKSNYYKSIWTTILN